MNDETKLEFEKLELAFNKALSVCDPIEFQVRQQKLLHQIALVLLKPYLDAKTVKDYE